ncbi:MAG: hypothetical protein K0R29_379 [Pseudobdellovibrio sp.]|nr:hypothetical protein [Pseudobdellovibrio sp.]
MIRRFQANRPGKLESLSASEIKFLKSLKNPYGIQKFLDAIPYHLADTSFSPRKVIQHRTAHCLEGAIFAAAALRYNGHPPLILDLEAKNDTDHVIAVFKENNGWGAIASSNYAGCRYRPPIHRTLRELALSYFNDYFNKRRERTLRTFSTRPVNLSRFDKLNWMTSEDDVWFIAEHLLEIPHTKLLTPQMERALTRIDERSFKAGTYGLRKKKS